ncbi:DMT family transporter [Kitasatospora mediocidica]|uniref:DMT family transporter n=1 Tax=Kitasatospora mediocidica TaxID=58352 RepID=UPI0007C6A6FB|nr:DMT family transporter [Kitasatospora mediocidica]
MSVTAAPAAPAAAAKHAMLLGALGVLAFSMTLPSTRVADPAFGGWTVAFGRALPAALLALLVLSAKRQPLLPPKEARAGLVQVAATVVVGFPLLTSLALQSVNSAHGAVVTGLIPAATAGFGVLLAGERPRRSYWIAMAVGLVGIVSLPVIQGAGRFQAGDLLLILAVAVVGFGYARGGVMARTYGGWRVICWALVLSLPVTVPLTALTVALRPPHHITAGAAVSMTYLGLVSMCLGFFFWYEGLARGGVARVGRLQLAQPVLTLGWSALLLGEHLDAVTLVAAVVVLGAVAVGRNARQTPVPAAEPVLPPSPAADEESGAVRHA